MEMALFIHNPFKSSCWVSFSIIPLFVCTCMWAVNVCVHTCIQGLSSYMYMFKKARDIISFCVLLCLCNHLLHILYIHTLYTCTRRSMHSVRLLYIERSTFMIQMYMYTYKPHKVLNYTANWSPGGRAYHCTVIESLILHTTWKVIRNSRVDELSYIYIRSQCQGFLYNSAV